jgi:hypothetical protein
LPSPTNERSGASSKGLRGGSGAPGGTTAYGPAGLVPGVGSGVGVGVGRGGWVGRGVGAGVEVGVEAGVGAGVGRGVGRGVDRGVRRGVAVGAGGAAAWVATPGGGGLDAAPADAPSEAGTIGASLDPASWLDPPPGSDDASLPPGSPDASSDPPGVPVADSTPPCGPRGSDWAAKAARTTTRTVRTPAIRRWSGRAPLLRAIGRALATGRVATGTTGGIGWAWGGAFETTNRVGTVGGGAPGTPIR